MTSGWNWTPQKRLSRSSTTVTRVLAVLAVTRKPGGILSDLSPWLIQTCRLSLTPAQEAASVEDLKGGEAVLALARGNDLASEEMGHELESVADAQDREAELEDPGRRQRGALLVDAPRAAGKDEGARGFFFYSSDGDIERHDLGIDPQLADLPGDELRVLRTEIEDEDLGHA